MRASDLDWLQKDKHSLRDLYQIATAGHNWLPVQNLPFDELILFAYAADREPPDLRMYAYHQDCILHVPDGSFFSVQRLHGFRQVVQHVQLHVAN